MIVIFLIVVLFLVCMIARVAWVGRIQTNWNNKVFDYRYDLIQDYKFEEWSKYTYFEYTEAIYSFHKMMLYFWLWNIDYMIENQELYNMVVKDNDSI